MSQLEYSSNSYFIMGLNLMEVLGMGGHGTTQTNLNFNRQEISQKATNYDKIEAWHAFLDKAVIFYMAAVIILYIPFLVMLCPFWGSKSTSEDDPNGEQRSTLDKLIRSWSLFANIVIILIIIFILILVFI